MTEPKKRGRPSKAEVAAREPKSETTHNGDTSGQLERAQDEQEAKPNTLDGDGASTAHFAELAQAYAMRVWAGQASDLKLAERIARIERALQGQNLPTEGIVYPQSENPDEWTEEDEKPITWRKPGTVA